MKKILLILLALLCMCSCSEKLSFTENEDGTLNSSDGQVYYPLENSHRYSDFGLGKKVGAILGADVFSLDNTKQVLYADSTYYVKEEYKSLDVLFEDCDEYLFVPKKDLDKSGRITEKYLKPKKTLKGENAQDFSFYIFYSHTPEEEGYLNGVYVGEIVALFETDLPLYSSYPVYYWDNKAYSVEIDGTHYMIEDEWVKKIFI